VTEQEIEKKPINGPKEFKKFKLVVTGRKGNKNILERDGNKPMKTCKMLQAQADELNFHRENTLIEYKVK